MTCSLTNAQVVTVVRISEMLSLEIRTRYGADIIEGYRIWGFTYYGVFQY
jgi:hypothetical protein